ncbi:WPP domain-interacting tail-anchored protein 1-like isoform X2 [Actinidia eriantha]|uniref:WPP domain-interacting tail-anchored protein 1-like isoform X2 n=1 Tax=Actinidia eriantha TaxID=165200 RepID=UPI00258DA139|nr:WPP domain-interacting tail-anchored protein 1-like isoform X2 [Actinidia eriantha]
MDLDAVHVASAPNEDIATSESVAELTNIDPLESISSSVDTLQVLGTVGEVLTRVELDLACFSEKVVNLNILTMHVSTRENDLEAFVSDKEHTMDDYDVKAMEFDLLSGILDSEVRQLDTFMSSIQLEIINVRETVSLCKNLEQASKDMEDKLVDSEESLKQSLDQLSEIRVQSAKFQKILSSFGGENNSEKGADVFGNGEFLDQNAKIKIQTAEQQRHFLRMLEKSLARELDLEKKVGETRQIEEEMKQRLYSSEQEIFFMEEEAADVWERLFEAENSAEVLMGISKEILGRLHVVQFNLNGSIQREENLRSELKDSVEKLKAKDSAAQKLEDKLALADSEAFTLREKVNSLEKHLKESEIELLNAKSSSDECQALSSEMHEKEKALDELKEIFSRVESRAESAEVECKLLTETNMKLNEDLRSASDKLDALERQLRESDIHLQRALASAEASLETQKMLYSTIHDMENLIEDLKSRVSKAERRSESAESKCITLSESNSDLNEELRFLRNRLGSLEASLREAEETKMATVKDIGIRTKVITNLVMQLAFERERLHKQISSLTKENKILIQKTDKDPSRSVSHDGRGNDKDLLSSKHGFSSATHAKESKEASDVSATSVVAGEKKLGKVDSTSKLETERNIDARQLNFKYGVMVVLTLAVSILAAFLFQYPQGQFW